MASDRRITLRKAAIAGAVVVGSIGAVIAYRTHERRELTETIRSRLAAQGSTLTLGAWSKRLFGDSYQDLRLDLGAGVSIAAKRVHVLNGLGSDPTVAIENVAVTLRGSPDALWEQWTKFSALSDLPIVVTNATVDYQDRAVGHVMLTNAQLEDRGEDRVLRATQMTFNGSSWNDVTLSISHPKTVVKIGIGSGTAELAYVPRPGQPAEWMINLPSQPLGVLLERLGTGPAASSGQSRIAGTLSVIVLDDAAKANRGSMQFILDNWFVPPWPDAKALTGKSGSIAIRMESSGDGSSWKLTRVEVGAALFTLVGTGTLTLGEPSRLAFEARGSRNCAQLAANLPQSVYRDAANQFLQRAKPPTHATGSMDTDRTPPAEEQIVDLQLNVDLAFGNGGQHSFKWHLAAGCGLAELQGDGVLGGQTRSAP